MALQKTITLPNGAVGNYIQLVTAAADYSAKYVPVEFALFMDAAHAVSNPTNPLCPLIAKMRLDGAKFDQYISTVALAAITADDPFRASLYAAAKAEPLLAGGGLTSIDLSDAVSV